MALTRVRLVTVSRRTSDLSIDWSSLGRWSQLKTQLRIGGRHRLGSMLRGAVARGQLGLEGWAEQVPLLNWAPDLLDSRKMMSAWIREARQTGDDPLSRHEERQFSQNGEDGIIRWILDQIGLSTGFFVEIGAADGEENCTRSLLESGWTGVWVEADSKRAEHARMVAAGRVSVIEKAAEPSTIRTVLAKARVPTRPDLVVVDIDSNDWWVLGALLSAFLPRVLVVEYNATYKPGQWWVQPYRRGACWDDTFRHGASLDAIAALAARFELSLVGCNSTGVNSFFVSNAELRGSTLGARQPKVAYHGPWFASGLWGHPRRPGHQAEIADAGRLASDDLSRISLRAARWPTRRLRAARCGSLVFLGVTIFNGTDKALTSHGATPVNLASRWRKTNAPRSSWFDEPRHPLPMIPPGAERSIRIWRPAPDLPGEYRLELALVQENVGWLDRRSVELGFEFAR